jgi:hypothetical protein
VAKPVAVVSCHVERPLDDRVWGLFSRLQRKRPGGFRVSALLRPPDAGAGEDETLWLERAREAAQHGPLGHHTHFVGPAHARPRAGGGEHAARVRQEAAWLREQGIAASFFCGGGWYMDEDVAVTLAELGYTDCTATAFRPTYLGEDDARLEGERPAWLTLPGNTRLLELPATHSLGMASRAALRALPPYVHVYFHDTDLLSRRRRLALRSSLMALGLRSRVTDLETLRDTSQDAPEQSFVDAVRGAVASSA